MIKKVFNKSGIAIDFGATKISASEIVRGKFNLIYTLRNWSQNKMIATIAKHL